MMNRHLASLALDEDSPYTNSCLFTLDQLPLLLLLRKNQFSSSPKTSQQSVRKPCCPLLVFNSPLMKQFSLGRIRKQKVDASVYVQYPRRNKAFNFDNSHNSFFDQNISQIIFVKMDSMSGCDIRLVFTFPPKHSVLQYKKCVNF